MILLTQEDDKRLIKCQFWQHCQKMHELEGNFRLQPISLTRGFMGKYSRGWDHLQQTISRGVEWWMEIQEMQARN